MINEGLYTDEQQGLEQTPLSGVSSIEKVSKNRQGLQQAVDRTVAIIQAENSESWAQQERQIGPQEGRQAGPQEVERHALEEKRATDPQKRATPMAVFVVSV